MIISVSLFPRCELCHSNSGEIGFQVYEIIDHTERQAAQAGTGAIMQGVTVSSTSFFLRLIQLFLSLITPFMITNAGVPANPRRDHEWVTKKETKLSFCKRMFSMMPSFFHHHQIDLAQRYGLKMLLNQIIEDCFLLALGVEYAQTMDTYLRFIPTPPRVFPPSIS